MLLRIQTARDEMDAIRDFDYGACLGLLRLYFTETLSH